MLSVAAGTVTFLLKSGILIMDEKYFQELDTFNFK